MFYSQFILAKKGPLGTIWIAAHLERKLRKNQVADTDIGVSVDSILFPDVPIALRLSSHLLLGVVRIYSRKVNYLFDDCSEALLKIKQAFRSTAVDLPPEESTAPYHSITLPETFDLDDFELPDNDIFHGNYVDHHVSTKEQITLQDSMDGVVYSTSQFGLDERFGDGDASHVGLDLEEDMFLDNVAPPPPEEVQDANPQASVASPARITGSSASLPVNGITNKIGGINADLEVMDYAQAPSTPGLVNEPNLSSVQEGLACDDHLESEDHNLRKSVGIESADNASIKLDCDHGDGAADLSPGSHANYDTIEPMAMATEEYDRVSADLEFNKENVKGKLPAELAVEYLEADRTASALHVGVVEDINKVTYNNESSMLLNGAFGEDVGFRLCETDIMDTGNEIEVSESHGKSASHEAQATHGPEEPQTLNNHMNNEQSGLPSTSVLRACSSFPGLLDASLHGSNDTDVRHPNKSLEDVVPCTSGKDGAFHSSGTSNNIEGEKCFITDSVHADESQLFEPAVHSDILEDEPHDNLMASNNQLGKLDASLTSELLAPEKLLSVPQMPLDKPDDLLTESTPDKDVLEEYDGTSNKAKVSGKKRTFTDSTLPVQSLGSDETFGMGKSVRTVNSIPDDDDLLSSILAGRRSSVLKIKPSPTAPEAVSMKRVRSSSHASTMKRKVLVDDSMVLLGNTIRQQLTNTEDIRRLRKKAPCTRSEILIIQRQYLEEEIFNEAVLTGMAMELTRLHGEKFDLSRIEIAEIDDNTVSLEAVKGLSSPRHTLVEDSVVQGDIEPVTSQDITDEQLIELPIQSENQLCEGHRVHPEDTENHGHLSVIAGISDVRTLEREPLGERTEVEIDQANHSVLETAQTEPVSRSITNMPAEAPIMGQTIAEDVSLPMDTTDIPGDELDIQLDGDNSFLSGTINGKYLEGMDILDQCTDNVATVTTDWGAGEEILLESKVDKSVEIMADVQADGDSRTDDMETSFVNVLSETDGYANATSLNIVEASVDIGGDKPGFNNDGGLAVNSGYDDKDQITNYLCSEECKVGTAYCAGPNMDIKNGSLNDIAYLAGHEADQQGIMDKGFSGGHYAEGQCVDSQDVTFANDTEFLNVDDDEMVEDDDGMPGAEDNRLFDNSGWSSRTRAVANYLQTLFDKEAEYGRVLTMDNLLTGKTRKEASRMFFETLVLKTKDYIHVEQAKPFENIRIKARAKLMKSDF